MQGSSVAVSAEEFRVRMRTIVVENLIAGFDRAEGRYCQCVVFVVDVCLIR